MSTPTIAAIAAVAENYVIGKEGDLPWRLPADLRWFVKNTRGKPVIFGRCTYESTGYLKGRKNIVVTTRRDYQSDCDVVAHSLDDALSAALDAEEVMILGGATIYEELMTRLDRFYLTVVHARPDGDTRFPAFDAAQWEVTFQEFRPADEKNPLPMTFYILDRLEYGEPPDPTEDLLPQSLRCPE